MYTSGMFLTESQKTTFAFHVQKFGDYYQLLRSLAHANEQLSWKIRPKTHQMQHLPRQARIINPRYAQAYLEEGLMGRIAKIWHSNSNGPYAQFAQVNTLAKYVTAYILRLEGVEGSRPRRRFHA